MDADLGVRETLPCSSRFRSNGSDSPKCSAGLLQNFASTNAFLLENELMKGKSLLSRNTFCDPFY